MSKAEQTLGSKRVGLFFNPTGNDLVSEIKKKTAELIDLCEKMRGDECSGEKHRVLSIAQTEFETACMFAVKANFID